MSRRFAFAAIIALCALSFAYANLQQTQKSIPNETKEARMFQGLRTVIYHVDDLQKAKEWYSNMLGIKPYFDEAFYVGFN
ncbi:MAG: VOC family protein, partial [Pyrinomonadaceae bacterium]